MHDEAQQEPVDLAIVIVTWNVRRLVLDCLQSVYDDLARAPLTGQVWLVDNDSTDGTAQAVRAQFPQVRLMEPGENLGFGRGNNLALRAMGFPASDGAQPEYVLLLNPDTIIVPGALRALVRAMESSGAGLAGARLVYGDGSFQHSAFAFPGLAQLLIDLFPVPARLRESRLNGRYPRRLYEGSEPFEVDHPLGAAFLLRKEAIRQTGLFDERFRLYCEEIDWAMRIRRQAQSVVDLWTARLKLYAKHYPPLKRWLAGQLVRAGMNRLIRLAARDSSRSEAERGQLVEAYRQVIRLSRRPNAQA
jgi:N-acetylglucosaminyl-diphospho-decaprenol L-rhamnosyltransferase